MATLGIANIVRALIHSLLKLTKNTQILISKIRRHVALALAQASEQLFLSPPAKSFFLLNYSPPWSASAIHGMSRLQTSRGQLILRLDECANPAAEKHKLNLKRIRCFALIIADQGLHTPITKFRCELRVDV
jgi:hypothetical protein